MKPNSVYTRLLKITILLFLLGINTTIFAQTPPPPPPPPNGGPNSGHGLGGNQGAANAPIGGGLEILLVLSALYSGRKVYQGLDKDTDTKS